MSWQHSHWLGRGTIWVITSSGAAICGALLGFYGGWNYALHNPPVFTSGSDTNVQIVELGAVGLLLVGGFVAWFGLGSCLLVMQWRMRRLFPNGMGCLHFVLSACFTQVVAALVLPLSLAHASDGDLRTYFWLGIASAYAAGSVSLFSRPK